MFTVKYINETLIAKEWVGGGLYIQGPINYYYLLGSVISRRFYSHKGEDFFKLLHVQ